MTDRIYHSMVKTDHTLGNKLGLRAKFFGHDWEPPTHIVPESPPEIVEASEKQSKGIAVRREDLPEAAYAWSPKNFARVGDLFYLGSFMAVKGRLAEVLAEADLGEGGLVRVPIYEADKETELEGPFYVLNFGARKDTLIGEQSRKVDFVGRKEETGEEFWAAKFGVKDGDYAVKASAAAGADIWVDPKLWHGLFMSGRLVDAISAAKVKVDFRLAECRIVEGG